MYPTNKMILKILQCAVRAVALSTVVYFGFLGLLTIPALQSQVIYLNRVVLTWFQDIHVPEQWGFMRNQVTPFALSAPDGETLQAWHILPIELYGRHEQQLRVEPSGLAADIRDRLSFKLLRDDPESLLVIYLHGAAGTLGSGYRPPSYRAISAGDPSKIHVVAIDYRGFGISTGSPSEEGLLTDALTLTKWAMEEARIPPSRTVVFAQSIGTAVATSLISHLALAPSPVYLRGMVLVAPFTNVEKLTETYRVAGTIPLLSPIARFPRLLSFFHTLIKTKLPSKDNIASFVRHCEGIDVGSGHYHITMIHAQDDYDIPWTHTEELYWHAVNASLPYGISFDELEREKESNKQILGDGGWIVDRRTTKGVLREEIAMHGLHDRIMSYPIVSLAILRAFRKSEADEL